MRQRHKLPISPELLQRSVDQEISIGAYARRQQRRRVLVGLLGAGLIAGACWIGWRFWPHGISVNDEYSVLVECSKCGQRSLTRVAFRQSFPIECPKCGAPKATPVFQCRNCGAQFTSFQKTAQVRCPKCKSNDVGSPLAVAATRPGP